MSKPLDSEAQSGDALDAKKPAASVEMNGTAEVKENGGGLLTKQDSMDCTAVEEGLTEDTTDEEENLFIDLEKEKEKEEENEALHPHDQPTDVTEAPRLLQDALKKGEVKDDDSNVESVNIAAASKIDEETESHGAVAEDDAATSGESNHHNHQRVSQLMAYCNGISPPVCGLCKMSSSKPVLDYVICSHFSYIRAVRIDLQSTQSK